MPLITRHVIFFISSHIQVSVLTEATSLTLEGSHRMREDKSPLMQTRKITKRNDLMENARNIREVDTSTASAAVEKQMARINTTTRRTKRHDLQTGAKRNTTSSFLASQFVMERSVSNATKTAPKNENASLNTLDNRNTNSSRGSYIPTTNRWRRGMNPCVRKIVKTYYSNLKTVLTEYKCRRATFYCSPTGIGLGRCESVKTYYPSINKILTTSCRCS